MELVVAPKQRMLGIIINTNNLTVGIPPDYVAEVLDLISTTWHSHRHCFTVGEAQKLTGKLGYLMEGAHWVLWECLTACKALSHANAKGTGTNDWVISRSLDD